MAGGAAGGQHHRDAFGFGSIPAFAVIVPPGGIGFQHLAVERNGPVERDDHDTLQRRHVFLQAFDLLIKPARHARRRRQQQFCLHRVQLGDDGLAREQEIDRLGDAAGGRAPDRGNGRGADRQQYRDWIVLADALRAKEVFGRLGAAHQPIVRDDDRIGVERRAQIHHRLGIGIGERPARDEIEDARAGRERFLHFLFARGHVGRR